MSMAIEVMKLMFAVLDVSFNSGHYTVIVKRQFLYINVYSTNDRRIRVTRTYKHAIIQQTVNKQQTHAVGDMTGLLSVVRLGFIYR